jgi:hypothetical protein
MYASYKKKKRRRGRRRERRRVSTCERESEHMRERE